MQEIYLDHAATTPVHPEVLEAMLPYYRDMHGNPSSMHRFGQRVRHTVDEARSIIARCVNAEPGEIIFTSGGTEADNMALIGVMTANRDKGKHLITSQIEHHAVLHTCEYLESLGYEVTYLPVDETGRVAVEDVAQAIRPDTVMISIMFGNNEVGTLQHIGKIGKLAKERGVYFHTDAVQAFGIEEVDVKRLHVDLLSISAHKVNGPKGVGSLYARRGIKIASYIHGGNQEKKRRAGTENVAGIVGFARAAELAINTREERRAHYEKLRRMMMAVWDEQSVDYVVNGHPKFYMPHILNVSFPGTKTEAMLMKLDIAGVAAASGSACMSGSLEISHVLRAMNLPEDRLISAIRFSFGYGNTEEQVREAAERIARIVNKG
ncbi:MULTISPECIES: cysteine desulfurase family protein [Aneurinibacillus]|uniref:cysteine desulfurase n=1 Tax=Aneurinibacillus thermoaerophilus TaxID=143495 RepID=A0A1G7YCW0_ANETH|nr:MULTISPECIES: cysteine desulfurase family protein [Aneurinibacillus]AMA72175.1 cysteine desulfurase NifS [Aneurinibacillus sp. XH2]MED0676460.1 cysteine desulfurase family protein [Aneurinibacillus thermoaerophilus]MED0678972.1 cysteine desulfurase family protein [Aneurinibacillus thermoaerophilus]MED0736509.1 cysteine desulfurase family protein [Aneurinibacillus thermoaerophilus]MED0756012.1 cysteine desulfurase family protein [Aneurinibacillus thermoaerophilus]